MRDAHDHESRLNHHEPRINHHESRLNHHEPRVNQRESRLVSQESKSTQRDARVIHNESRFVQCEAKFNHHEVKVMHHDAKALHHEANLNHHEVKSLYHEAKLNHHEVKSLHHEAKLNHHETKIVHHDSRPIHHEPRIIHYEKRHIHHECDATRHESRLAQNEPRLTQNESRLAQNEPRLTHQESKLIQHESKLIQRQMYLKEKVRCRKMLLGSVIPSDVGSEVGRSRPSSVYRQRESKCWRKHVVSTDSGYSGTSRRQSETEDTEVPTIYADVGPVVCLRLPTKCRKCRRIRNEMKDASSQHSHPPSDDSRPSSPLTETLMSVVVDAPDVLSLPPPDRIFQCRVVRDKNSFGTNFYPVYRMYLERDAKADALLLVARKRKKCSTSKYLILTGSDNLSRRSPTVVGKLRSNLIGTRFSLTTSSGTSVPTDSCLLFYETNILGTKGPRRMRVFLPEDAESPVDLFDCYRRQSMDGVLHLVNKEPEWDKETLSHVLYFEGRVTKSSVKNFQLVIPSEEEVLLQFGKIGRDEFTLDYQRPLNAVQAFAIALSSFDYKIACE